MHILIIGIGGIGKKHIRAFLDSGCRVSCFDLDISRSSDIKSQYEISQFYSDLHAIPSQEFDGAVIATPTDTHVEYAHWCLSRGLPFLLEKPLSIDEAGVSDLLSKSSASKLVAGVAYPRRSSMATREIERILSEGTIGELKIIRSNFSQDYRKYRPDYKDIYYAKLASGGGCLLDALSHHINYVTHFSGDVESVSAFYDRLVFEGCEGEDCGLINLRFKNGMLGSVSGNQFQKPNIDEIEFVGTKGNLVFERVTGKLKWNCSDSSEWNIVSIAEDWSQVMKRQAEDFISALKGDGKPRTTLEDGWHTVQVLLAAKQSQTNRCFVTL